VNVAPDVKPLAAISRILIAQLSAGLLIGAIALVLADRTAALSAILGGLICVIPNAFLGLRMIVGGSGRDARGMLRASYVGMAGKLLLTAALFAAVFALVRPLAAGWLFGAFVLTQAIVWIFLVADRGTGT
jgi:ATP synthase protein I